MKAGTTLLIGIFAFNIDTLNSFVRNGLHLFQEQNEFNILMWGTFLAIYYLFLGLFNF